MCAPDVDNQSTISFDNRGLIYNGGTARIWCPITTNNGVTNDGIEIVNMDFETYTNSTTAELWTWGAKYLTPTGTLYSAPEQSQYAAANTYKRFVFPSDYPFGQTFLPAGGALSLYIYVAQRGSYVMGYNAQYYN